MLKEYKLEFNYKSKIILEQQLISLEYFDIKSIDNYSYKAFYNGKNYAFIRIEEYGLLLHNYQDNHWLLNELEYIIGKSYSDLTTINLTDNVLYACEKLNITQEWIDFGVLSEEEVEIAYKECITSSSWYYPRKIQIKYMHRWLKNKKVLEPKEFDFILSVLENLPFFIETIPLNKEQLQKLEILAIHNNSIENELLHRKVINSTLSKKLLYDVLENNISDTIKALVNKTNNHEYLEYILKHNKLSSDKVDNIIQKKLGITVSYSNKTKKKRVTKSKAKVHILLARESSLALIIRRKPTKRTCTILWDRADNTFSSGDCVTMIEAKYCDLSPDGKHLFYFAGIRNNYWVAICKTPILSDKVVHLKHPVYGGNFIDNNKFQVHNPFNYFFEKEEFIKSSHFHLKNSFIDGEGDDYYRAYINRLIRDGWEVLTIENKNIGYKKYILKKKLTYSWHLEKTFIGRREEYRLIKNNEAIDCLGWDWAEYDKGELLFTKEGCLYRLDKIPHIDNAELIKDLNNITEQIQHPFMLNGSQNLQAGNYLGDTEALKRAIDEGHDDAYFYLADSSKYKKEKEFEFREELYQKGMKLLKKKSLLSYWHFDMYGRFLFEHKKFEEALTLYKSSLKLMLTNDEKANAYLYLTVLSAYIKDEKSSQEYEIKAKKIFRKDRKDYSYQLAHRYKKIAHYEKAYNYYILSIKNNQEDAIKGHGRKQHYYELEEVCQDWNKNILDTYLLLKEDFPNDKSIDERLPIAYLEANKIDEAYLSLEKVLRLDSNDYRQEYIRFDFAKKLFESKEYDLALDLFKKLIINETFCWSIAKYKNYIGVIYTSKKEYEKAKIYFKEAMELNDGNALYRKNYEEIKNQSNNDILTSIII